MDNQTAIGARAHEQNSIYLVNICHQCVKYDQTKFPIESSHSPESLRNEPTGTKSNDASSSKRKLSTNISVDHSFQFNLNKLFYFFFTCFVFEKGRHIQ